MDPNAPSYIEREADSQLLAALLAGEYVFLLDSRQKGKSSMVARTIVKLREKGIATVKLDLQRIGANVTPEQWYAGLLTGVGQELGLTEALFDYWESHTAVGPLARLIGALQEIVLEKINTPVVVFIDEIDFVRALPFSTDEFFAAIRDCYNRRSDVAEFQRLTFCLVGVATPGQLIRNPDITPFNIGTRIDLTDFSENELAPFAQALSQDGLDGRALASRVFHWVSGHPYLTQLLCSKIIGSGADPNVDHLVETQLFNQEARQREPNLSDVERRLLNPDIPGLEENEKRTRVLELYRTLLKGKPITTDDENPLIATLKLSGVSLERNGALVLRNRVYESIFGDSWVQASLPDAETRRQRKAAWAGAFRVAAVSACLLAIFAGVAAYTWNLSRERSKAIQVNQRLTAQAERNAYNIGMFLLSEQASRGNWIRAATVLRNASTYAKRGWEWQFWNARLNGQRAVFQTPTGHAEVAFSRDSLTFAVVTEDRVVLSSGEKHKPQNGAVWQISSVTHAIQTSSLDFDDEMSKEKLQRKRSSIAFLVSPNGGFYAELRPKRVVVITNSNGSELWRTQSDVNARVCRISFDHSSRRLAIVTEKVANIYSAIDGSLLTRMDVRGANNVRFSSGDQLVAFPTTDSETKVFQTANGRRTVTLTGHTAPVHSAAFAPGGNLIATGGFDGTVRLYSLPSGRLVDILVGHVAMVSSCDFSPDGRTLVSRSQDGEVRVWDLRTPSPLEVLDIHTDQVVRLHFSKDGSRLVTSSRDQTVVLYDVAGRRIVRRIQGGPIIRAHALSFSSDGRRLAASLPNGGLGLFDSVSGSLLRTYQGGKSQVNHVQFDSAGMRLLTVCDDGTAKVLSTEDGKVLASIVNERKVMAGSISGDGTKIALGLDDHSVELYEVGAERPVQTWRNHSERIYYVTFSPDGATFATTAYDGTVGVFDVRTLKATILPGDPTRIWEALYSPDGSKLLVNAYDGTARLWDLKTAKPILVMRHDSWVAGAEFSPDQSRIITCSDDKTIRIWDAETGDELTALRGHSHAVFRAKMSPNQEFIASASSDGTVRLWHAKRRTSN